MANEIENVHQFLQPNESLDLAYARAYQLILDVARDLHPTMAPGRDTLAKVKEAMHLLPHPLKLREVLIPAGKAPERFVVSGDGQVGASKMEPSAVDPFDELWEGYRRADVIAARALSTKNNPSNYRFANDGLEFNLHPASCTVWNKLTLTQADWHGMFIRGLKKPSEPGYKALA